jgi:AraC-like DNA-binding protein
MSAADVEAGSIPIDVSGKLADMIAEIRGAIRGDPIAAYRCIDKFVSFLLQTSIMGQEQSTLCRGGLAPWQVSKIKQHIETNLTARLPTAELAALVRLSAKHFSRAFKVSVGCSPHAYIVLRRVAYAKKLLLGSDAPPSQVALACGFNDQSHFCRLFRRLTGISPSVWRRQHRVFAVTDGSESFSTQPAADVPGSREHCLISK